MMSDKNVTYDCDTCGDIFMELGTLTEHIRMHHRNPDEFQISRYIDRPQGNDTNDTRTPTHHSMDDTDTNSQNTDCQTINGKSGIVTNGHLDHGLQATSSNPGKLIPYTSTPRNTEPILSMLDKPSVNLHKGSNPRGSLAKGDNRVYTCDVCYKVYPDQERLKKHRLVQRRSLDHVPYQRQRPITVNTDNSTANSREKDYSHSNKQSYTSSLHESGLHSSKRTSPSFATPRPSCFVGNVDNGNSRGKPNTSSIDIGNACDMDIDIHTGNGKRNEDSLLQEHKINANSYNSSLSTTFIDIMHANDIDIDTGDGKRNEDSHLQEHKVKSDFCATTSVSFQNGVTSACNKLKLRLFETYPTETTNHHGSDQLVFDNAHIDIRRDGVNVRNLYHEATPMGTTNRHGSDQLRSSNNNAHVDIRRDGASVRNLYHEATPMGTTNRHGSGQLRSSNNNGHVDIWRHEVKSNWDALDSQSTHDNLNGTSNGRIRQMPSITECSGTNMYLQAPDTCTTRTESILNARAGMGLGIPHLVKETNDNSVARQADKLDAPEDAALECRLNETRVPHLINQTEYDVGNTIDTSNAYQKMDSMGKLCAVCNKPISLTNETLKCELCLQMFCLGCSGLSRDVYEASFKVDTPPCVLWMCNVCRPLFPTMSAVLHKLATYDRVSSSRLSQMEHEIDRVIGCCGIDYK